MKEWKKIPMILLVMTMAAYLMAGCGSINLTDSADMNTVSIKKDGTIEQMIIDKFEKDYYDIDELAAKAQEKIDDYSDGTDNIVLKSAQEDDGKIIVKMVYKTGDDYTQFNNRELFYGTVADASAMGYTMRNIISEDGIVLKDIEQILDNHVVIIQIEKGEELDVNVYDKILYTSDNVVKSGKNDVIITAKESDTISCIVFK